MGLASLRGTILRGFLLLSLCLSLVIAYKILYLDESPLLTATSLGGSNLGEILRQGADAISWPLNSPSPQDTTTPLSVYTAEEAGELTGGALSHLQDLCDSTLWRPDLSLHCHSRCGPDKTSFCGGLNNARDRLQTCLRLAIDAGATTVFIPSIAARSESALWTIDPSAVAEDVGKPIVLCPEAWFSLGRLRDMLSRSCHQLRVESVCPMENSIIGVLGTPSPKTLQMPWRSLGGDAYDTRPGHKFREAIDQAMLDTLDIYEKTGSILAEYGDTYIACRFLSATKP